MQIQQPMQEFAVKRDLTTAEGESDSSDTEPQSEAAVSKIAAILQAQAPDVQPAAIAEHLASEAQAGPTDAAGELFNEAIHVRDVDGQPRKTTRGNWALKRGRKAGAQSAKSVVQGLPTAPDAPMLQARAAGENAAVLLVTVARTFGGEEWEPILSVEHGIDEMSNLRKSFADYFAAKNLTDIPPGIALSIAVIGYAGPRFFAPKTKARVSAVSGWISAKSRMVASWFSKRKPTQTANTTQSVQ